MTLLEAFRNSDSTMAPKPSIMEEELLVATTDDSLNEEPTDNSVQP